MIIEILEVIGGIIGILAILIVIWDHFKDDRRLTKQVQKFYYNIEKLILSVYKESSYKKPVMQLLESLKSVGEPEYQKAKVKQNFEEFSKYLGLTKITSYNHHHKNVDAYINNEGYLLLEDGWLKQKRYEADDRFIIGNSNYHEETFMEIRGFLGILRNYWNNNYSKLFFRPKLHPGLKIFK